MVLTSKQTRRGSRIFSRGDFQTFFLGWSNWFFELTKITVNTPLWPNLLRRKVFLAIFWQILTKNVRFFGSRFSLKISINWRQRRLYKKCRVRQQKWVSQNSTEHGPFGSAGGTETNAARNKRHHKTRKWLKSRISQCFFCFFLGNRLRHEDAIVTFQNFF